MENKENQEAVNIYLRGIAHIIQDNKEKIERFEFLKMNSLRSAPFEVGYLYYVIQDEYRRMVDRYNTSMYMNTRLYLMELVLYLEEIEMGYWRIEHLANMLHEIERKYKDRGKVNEVYINPDLTTKSVIDKERIKLLLQEEKKKNKQNKKKKVKKNRGGSMNQWLFPGAATTKKSTRWWWPIEYGWEIDYYW